MMTMSDIVWSKEQRQAIEHTSSNCLISAGAGSGKTAVLTQRIYELVKKGADISRFLVLTFTEAAAAEMKKRTREKILEDKELAHLSSKVEASHIETFDAFALFLVKKYASYLRVSPNIGIIDKSLLLVKRNLILDDVLTYLYSNKDSDFINLISTYCTKNDAQIRDFILDFCNLCESKPDKYSFLDNIVPKFYNLAFVNSCIDIEYQKRVNAIKDALIQLDDYEDVDYANELIEYFEDVLSRSHDYDSMNEILHPFSFPTKKAKGNIIDRRTRDAIKDELESVFKPGDATKGTYGTSDEIRQQYLGTQKFTETIIRIVKEIETRLDAFKKEKNAYAFSDVAYMALKVLDNPQIRKEMSDYFEYILVDEYQDTSAVQEAVVQKLGRNNICMVGDVKQSIYRFRGADCSIFQDKYNKYNKHIGGELINLNASYRSRKEIVDLVNEMFSELMTSKFNPINYKDGHIFGYGFTNYDNFIDDREDYKLKVYNYLKEPNKDEGTQEAEIIVRDIINKINNKYQIYDTKREKLRDCRFNDFAIIASKGKKFNQIKKVFFEHGVPLKILYKEEFRDSDVVRVLNSFLVVIREIINGNTESNEFVHGMVSLMRSYIFEYKDSDIYELVKHHKLTTSDLYKDLNAQIDDLKKAPLEKLLKDLVARYDIDMNCAKIGKYGNNTNKIEMFINIAKSMDELGFDIDGLITYFEKLNKMDLDTEYTDNDVSENSVTVMTIHGSKGLEFPVLYMPLLTSTGGNGRNTSFFISDKYGPIYPIIGDAKTYSLFNRLMKDDEKFASFEERLRLFYVGVTRARERLIFVSPLKEKPKVCLNPRTTSTMDDLLEYLGTKYKYNSEFITEKVELKVESHTKTDKKISLQNVQSLGQEVVIKKASKDTDEEVDQKLLEFGNEIHYLLENINFETKDLSLIKDARLKKYVNNVLSAEIFKNVQNNQVLHEFPFKDEQNSTNGVIDCLLLKDDEVDIVDFKLKNLDDDKYVLQLHTYYDYIKQITDLPIKMYLVAAITGEVKEIE